MQDRSMTTPPVRLQAWLRHTSDEWDVLRRQRRLDAHGRGAKRVGVAPAQRLRIEPRRLVEAVQSDVLVAGDLREQILRSVRVERGDGAARPEPHIQRVEGAAERVLLRVGTKGVACVCVHLAYD